MTGALGALSGLLFVLLLASRLALGTARREAREAREATGNARLEAASLAERLTNAARDQLAAAAASDLGRQLAAGNVPRETFTSADGEVLCTACYRRSLDGQNAVQGCGDCWWLEKQR